MADKVKLIVICGPTASGKTKIAVELAKKCNAEIISADSMQIYQGLTIGTAAPTAQEMQGIQHHLLGIIPPQETFSVAQWVQAAQECIQDIVQRGKMPILAGGTGLYLSSLINGVQFSQEETNLSLRKQLQEDYLQYGAQAMYEQLLQKDEAYAKTVHPNNVVRVLRALERIAQTGESMTQQLANSRLKEIPYEVSLWGLAYDDREQLYQAIEQRIDLMMEHGLLEEASFVYQNRQIYHTAAQAIGYKEFFPFFDKFCTLSECILELKKATRHYAKRQLTWFRHMPHIKWEQANDLKTAERIAQHLHEQRWI